MKDNKNSSTSFWRKLFGEGVNKIIVVITIFIILLYGLNLMGNISMLGLRKIHTAHVDGVMKHVKIFDVDDTPEILNIVIRNGRRILDIYKWNNEDLERIDSITIQPLEGEGIENVRTLAVEILEIDRDGNFKILMAESQDGIYKLKLYKKIDNKLEVIDYKKPEKVEYSSHTTSSLKSYRDSNGKQHILWTYNNKQDYIISSYLIEGDKLRKEFYETVDKGRLVEGDFNGDGIKNLYYICREDRYININRLEILDNRIELIKEGEINPIYDIVDSFEDSGGIKISDVNGDGRDDIVFLAVATAKKMIFSNNPRSETEPWLRVYSLEENKWEKIWSGGNIRKFMHYREEYRGRVDINKDGIDEIIITHNHELDNMFNGIFGYGDDLESQIYFYHIDKYRFKLNTLMQKINITIEL